MSSRPCPRCGAPLTTQARFCGQCGSTIEPPNIHDDVTRTRPPEDDEVTRVAGSVSAAALAGPAAAPQPAAAARPGPGGAAKTLFDPAPYGSQPPPGQAPAANPTPLVPGPVPAAAIGEPLSARSSLSETVADPEAEAKVKEAREAALKRQSNPPPPKPLLKTMMMAGGSHLPGEADRPGRPSDRPTSPPAPPGAGGASPSNSPASPLSRSVLAPHSWHPPAPGTTPGHPTPGGGPPGTPSSPARPTVEPAPATVQPAPVVSVGLGPSPDPRPGPAANPLLQTQALVGSPPAPPAQPAPAAAPAQGDPPAAARTMIGMSMADLGVRVGPAPSPAAPAAMPPQHAGSQHAAPEQHPQRPAPGPAAAFAPAQKTMMGVAIPGIAPLAASAEAGPTGGAVDLRSKQSTMLGVAVPGIAPTGRATAAMPQQALPRVPSQVQNTALGIPAPQVMPIVPRPAPLHEEPLPEAPRLPEKRGVSALAVVGIVFVLVAILGGAGAFFALRNAGGSIVASPQLDDTGHESLKIACPTCPDGTVLTLGASSATVSASAAVLPLPAPLMVGDNDLSVKIDRPASGRDEEVKVHVPVAYRVRADLSTLSARPPTITVRVEANPGSEVKVEDKPVALDATGRGAFPLDLSKEIEGEGDAKAFERKVPFSITSKGKTESGSLIARTSVVALALDAPGSALLTDKPTAPVAGQTRGNATVTVDGKPAPVDAEGRFAVRVELPASGPKDLEIVVSAPPLAPRIVHAKVTRVASLEAGAKDLEAARPIGYDAFGADPASKVGQAAVVEGEVLTVRSGVGHTVLVVEDRRTCAKGASCPVRVVHGEEDKVARGDTVRAYGRVHGAVSASGKTVPDLEASVVLLTKAAQK